MVGESEQLPEPALEVGVRELAGLQAAKQGQRLAVAAEQLADRFGRQPLALAE